MERNFLSFLHDKYLGLEFINENNRLNKNQYDSTIEIAPIINGLQLDNFPPQKRKQICIETLTNLYLEKVSIFEFVNQISSGFTLEPDGNIYFFELHEDNHK